jgi:hypothetical protein
MAMYGRLDVSRVKDGKNPYLVLVQFFVTRPTGNTSPIKVGWHMEIPIQFPVESDKSSEISGSVALGIHETNVCAGHWQINLGRVPELHRKHIVDAQPLVLTFTSIMLGDSVMGDAPISKKLIP